MSYPPPDPLPVASYQSLSATSADGEQLNVLAICHYVWAGLLALFSCFGLLYVALGGAMIWGAFTTPPPTSGAVQPIDDKTVGYILAATGGVVVLVGWAIAIGTLVAGRAIKRRRRWTFVVVMAAVNCLMLPIGTVLGIFTLIVLVRPTVRETFRGETSMPTAAVA